jgi:hypothetical protein
MLDSLFSYINEHTWAQWAFGLLLVAPPVFISWANGERGLAPVGTILGWWALLIIVAILLL